MSSLIICGTLLVLASRCDHMQLIGVALVCRVCDTVKRTIPQFKSQVICRSFLFAGTGAAGAMNDGRGVVICNAQAIIQMTNQALHNMFGYTKTELRGKNVAMLMPPHIAAAHTSYGESCRWFEAIEVQQCPVVTLGDRLLCTDFGLD